MNRLPSVNRERMVDPVFVKACELAEIDPTTRQASKYFRGFGKAYRHRAEAERQSKYNMKPSDEAA